MAASKVIHFKFTCSCGGRCSHHPSFYSQRSKSNSGFQASSSEAVNISSKRVAQDPARPFIACTGSNAEASYVYRHTIRSQLAPSSDTIHFFKVRCVEPLPSIAARPRPNEANQVLQPHDLKSPFHTCPIPAHWQLASEANSPGLKDSAEHRCFLLEVERSIIYCS